MIARTRTAEEIAYALPKAKRMKGERFIACCPAHDDHSPSLQITQAADKVLFKCWSGCTGLEVIESLQGMGILPKATGDRSDYRDVSLPPLTQGDRDFMQSFVLLYRSALERGITPTARDTRLYERLNTRLKQEGIYL